MARPPTGMPESPGAQTVADMLNPQDQIFELQQKLSDLIQQHRHDGLLSTRINYEDILGQVEVVSAVPASTNPKDVFDQIKIYVSGATVRLYVFDTVGHTWYFFTSANGAIATSATSGHGLIPTCAGTPTGVPAAGNGSMVYDTTNNKLYVYNSGWKGVTLA